MSAARGLAQQDIGIIVLAAGRSRRFKGDKRLASLSQGATLLDTTVQSIPEEFTHKLLVVRPGEAQLAASYAGHGWQIHYAPDSHLGMGHSLATAIRQVQDWPACLVALGDMPFINPQTYLQLRRALVDHPLVVPVHHGRRGNPAGFHRRFFGSIARLEGDRGARQLLMQHANVCHEVICDDPGIFQDIDTPTALMANVNG
jgi:molybdenum cofactor cytidylyltransferase